MADPNPELIPSASVVPTSSPYALSLEDDSRGIRIALLQPGQWEDPIYCELTKTSLESPLQFEALSYVWAQERGTKSIVLNGLTHTVTTNLFMALRRLRKHREVRSIWIDALCIDQNNIEERNHQVTLMGNIYWTCTKTIAWLGDYESPPQSPRQTLLTEQTEDQPWAEICGESWNSEDRAFVALNFIHELADGRHLFDTSLLKSIFDSPGPLESRDVRSLEFFVDLPWWNRVWTVQEAVLPPALLVIYGSFCVNWTVLEAVSRIFYKHASSCCSKVWSLQDEYRMLSFMLKATERLVTLVHGLEETRRVLIADREQHFHTLLWTYRKRQATNPRDLIYGLLGLATGGVVSTLKVDYSLPGEDVFKLATLSSIDETGKLHILQNRRSLQPQRTSWLYRSDDLPDTQSYSRLWDAERTRLFQANTYKASSDSRAVARECQNRLILRGTLAGKVLTVGSAQDSGWNELASFILEQWWCMLVRFYSEVSSRYQDSNSAYLRTMVSDISHELKEGYLTSQRISSHDLRLTSIVLELIMEQKRASIPVDGPARLMYAHIVRSTKGRRFFITENGYMGLGRPEVGDEVWVLFGGDTPFVLRPSTSDPGCHLLVGDCYVHGLMDGEAMVDVEEKTETVTLC